MEALTTDNTQQLDTKNVTVSNRVIVLNKPVIHTGDTVKKELLNGIIPANSITQIGLIDIMAIVENTGTGTKTLELKFNDIVVLKKSYSSVLWERWSSLIWNVDDVKSQVQATYFGSTKVPLTIYNFDTTRDISVSLTAQNSSNASVTKIHLFSLISCY